ncbi:MAG: DNA ligase D [Opitutaceae bacterium]|nr:DNA ligase D [Verrucomicrobiales bacterium]
MTPEPQGKKPRTRQRSLEFVIQKHAASSLHYDFRLELNGVLLSWAVPKGPSLDPNDKRLAMHVEDHPMEYGVFEGIIPAKQYGGGTVLLWDKGTWVPKEDPAVGYKKGKLKFDLAGEKLHGGWTLVRTHSSKYGGDKAWLLIKEEDEFAKSGADARIVDDKARSVTTGRTMEQIAAEHDRVWHSNKSVKENVRGGAVKKRKSSLDPSTLEGAADAPMPRFVKPQLATLVKKLPAGDNWIAEIKFDGYRMLCRIEDGEARLYSRNDKEWTANFPSIARAAAHLPVDNAWLDGEVVMLDAEGRSSFQSLQNALSENDESTLSYFLFDIPYLNGVDLRRVPLLKRKQVLERICDRASAPLHLSFYTPGRGDDFLGQACKLGLEGMILKVADSPYSGARTRSWLKLKCGKRQEMVIGGYTDPEGSRQGFGALLMGVYEDDGALRYSGKVGTGFDDKTLADLRTKLGKLAQDQPAFINPPRGAEARKSHWVKPELVAEVAFTEWTNDGTLRHPSFQGLRIDKKATDVVREEAMDSTPEPAKDIQASKRRKASVSKVELSNQAKVFYPESGLTKQDLANYYESISEWILPHLRQRPLSLLRCPNGWGKECFYQKNVDRGAHEAIDRVKVEISDGPALYMMANSTNALVALVQMGVLEIHPWGSTAPNLGKPDRIIFDFDPDDDLPWTSLVEAVRLMQTLLDQLGLQGFLKTTGGKGLHVVVPIQATQPWAVIKNFSKAVAELFAATFPDRFTAKISKATRRGKIFIDYLRNDEGSTAIAPYSTRAREKAPVSMPIAWSELAKDLRFDHFNVRTAPLRLKRLKKDPWEDFFAVKQSITVKLLAKVGANLG